MNFFEADGMCKIGNVELKFLVDFEKNGDMLLWKTVKHRGFVYTKSISGAYIYQNTVRIMTPCGAADISCDCDDTAQKILNIITSIEVKLYVGKKMGAYNLEKIGDDCVKSTEGCGGECTCEGCTCGNDKDDDTEDFIKFMDGFFEHMKSKLKENK